MVESAVESSSKLVVGLTENVPIRVLHVDDDAGFLKVAQQLLEIQGAFEVDTALSVEEAVAKMKEKTFDVIVSDYQMPEKSGLEFLKELRDSGNNVPFILFTGKGREEVVIKALNLGADQYLNKFGAPETVYGELAHGIRKSVEVRKAETALQESEERFRSIVENSHDGILMIDNKFMITYTNDEASHIIGYSKEEIVGHSFMKFLSEESKNLVKDHYLRRQKGERVTSTYEFKVVRKDGQKREVEIKATVMRDSRGMMQTVAQLLDITERKKIEDGIRESEEKYRGIVELAPDGIVTANMKGVITSVNSAFLRATDFSKDEIVGKHFTKLGSTRVRDIPKYLKLMSSALRGKIPPPFKYVYARKDGTTGWGEAHVGFLKKSGKTTGFQVFLREITERKKAEKALEESEQKLRDAINTSPDGIAWIDTAGKITLVNKKLLEVTGFSKKDFIGKNFMAVEALTQESKERIMENFRKRIEGIDTPPYEVELITKNKEIVPAELSASLIYEGDKIIGTQAILRDITERKKAEEAIRVSREKFERLFIDNPEAAVYLDSGFHILDINPRFAKLFSYSLSEVKGKHINSVLVPEDRMEEAERFDKKASQGETYQEDAVRKRKDGALFPVSFSAAPIVVENKVTGHVAVYKDISSLKRAEEKLKMTLEKVHALNEKLGVVGRLTRHDVRNKLSSVTANVYLAKQKLTGDDEALEYLNEIQPATSQIERIFDFARNYEKLGVEELAYVDAEKTIGEAVSLFSDLQGIRVVNDCRGLTVLADSLLRQLFYNLIHNSLKHGEKVSQIKVYYKEVEKDQLKLVYEDNGVGIPDAEKDKIFSEGYGKGTGYGLYLIRKICEVYGWTIQETGKPGEGARFTITIPKMNESRKESYRI